LTDFPGFKQEINQRRDGKKGSVLDILGQSFSAGAGDGSKNNQNNSTDQSPGDHSVRPAEFFNILTGLQDPE